MKKLNPFRKLKKVELTASQKIEVAEGKIEEAFSMFTKAHSGIEEANTILEESISQHEAEKRSLLEKFDIADRYVVNAQDKMKVNNALKVKLAEFIPGR